LLQHAVPPNAGYHAAIRTREGSCAISMTILELAHLVAEVAVHMSTPAMLQIILLFADIMEIIMVLQAATIFAFATSFAGIKMADVNTTRCVLVSSIAIQLAMMKFSLSHINIVERSTTCAMFLAIAAYHAACVNAAARPEEIHLQKKR
jgi:hypothetical protein